MNIPRSIRQHPKTTGLVLIVAILFIGYLVWPEAAGQSPADGTQEYYNQLYLKVATDGHWGAVEEIGDPAFTKYMHEVLEKHCPFYEPDGSGYRDCLLNLVDTETAAYTKQRPTLQEIDTYCQAIGSRWEGLLAGEMVLSCKAYRLSS